MERGQNLQMQAKICISISKPMLRGNNPNSEICRDYLVSSSNYTTSCVARGRLILLSGLHLSICKVKESNQTIFSNVFPLYDCQI
jgi:hypothetical protein